MPHTQKKEDTININDTEKLTSEIIEIKNRKQHLHKTKINKMNDFFACIDVNVCKPRERGLHFRNTESLFVCNC